MSVKDGSASSLVVDKRIVRYGSIPPLTFPKSDDCSLRFESSEVTFDLLQSMDADRK